MRDTIRFLHGDTLHEIRGIDPTLTILDWLRLTRGQTGTKEGCAEGDCGACTVVVVRYDAADHLHYDAVNACIRFLPTLDGCQLLTVEQLAAPDGTLHPVQQAMVDCHGSQCGFCTPGFVMSLFAFYRHGAAPDSERVIDEALAGNLCRCTGYAPIAAAARRAFALCPPDQDRFAAAAAATTARLVALRDDQTLHVTSAGRSWYAPATLADFAALAEQLPAAVIVAGATDVGLWVTKQQRQLDLLLSVGRVAELHQIVDDGPTLTIGAAATYAAAAPALAAVAPDLGALIRRIGAVQVRNVGTIGGNIANGSPIGDMPPALIAAGATLVLRRGVIQRRLPLEDFFITYGRQDRQPGEFVEAVIVPKFGAGSALRVYKITKRLDQDISALCGAFAVTVANGVVTRIRIAFGGMAATPKRARHTETALIGQPWRESTIRTAIPALAQDYTPLSDWRASAAYRAEVAGNLLLKFFLETSGEAARRGAETRIVPTLAPLAAIHA